MFKLQRKGFYNLEPRDENLNKEKLKIDKSILNILRDLWGLHYKTFYSCN